MAKAPVADQKQLLRIQDLDNQLDQLARRRADLPEAQELQKVRESLKAADAEQAGAHAYVGDIRREVTRCEDEVSKVRQREERDNKLMEAGQGNAKDLQGLQSELESLGRRRSSLEDDQLAVMERLDEAEATLERLTAKTVELTAKQAQLEVDVETILRKIDADIREIEASRETDASGIDVGLMSLYQRLRAQKGGIAVGKMQARRCTSCGFEIPPGDLAAIRESPEDQIIRCEECGRILVRGEDSGL